MENNNNCFTLLCTLPKGLLHFLGGARIAGMMGNISGFETVTF